MAALRRQAPGIQRVSVAGRTGVPAGATAVVVNVTVDAPERNGFATVYPCGTPQPLASNVNFTRGRTTSNAATVALGTSGEICVSTSAATHVVVDVMAVVVPGSPQVLRTPNARVLDTRDAGTSGRLAAGQVRTVRVGEPGQVVVLNVTIDDPAGDGFVTVFPCAAGRPWASTVNVSAGRARANAAVVATGSSGEVCVYSSTSADLIVDVAAAITA